MVQNGRRLTEALLPDDPSYKESVEILGKGYTSLRMNNRKLVQNTTPQMDIQASLSEGITFTLGDVLCHDGGHWLCIESYNYHDIYRTGKVEECNYLLKWQNPKTLEIIERWCSVRDPYASGLDYGNVVTTGNAKYKIKLPRDEETALFHVDQRFLIDIANNEAIPYAIVKYDSVTNQYRDGSEGFLVINLRESQIVPGDSREHMIAEYQNMSTADMPPVGECDIVYKGGAVVKAGGSAKAFRAGFRDGDGGEVTGISPEWELALPDELTDGQVHIVSDTGNEIKLKADGGAKIGSVFSVKMTADGGAFVKIIDVKVGGLL